MYRNICKGCAKNYSTIIARILIRINNDILFYAVPFFDPVVILIMGDGCFIIWLCSRRGDCICLG